MKGNPNDFKFATRAIHAGQPPDPRQTLEELERSQWA